MDPTQVLRGDDGVFRCRECGFLYALSGAEISRTCATTVTDVREAALAVPDALRSRRVAPAVWSPNAYCAHLADASELIEGRVRRIATEDRPLLRSYDQDEAAVRGRFDEVAMDASLQRIDTAVARFVALLDALPDQAWQRAGVHEEAGELRLQDIAHDMPHELTHHAGDLRRIGAQLRAAG
jgi:hypothetical protein